MDSCRLVTEDSGEGSRTAHLEVTPWIQPPATWHAAACSAGLRSLAEVFTRHIRGSGPFRHEKCPACVKSRVRDAARVSGVFPGRSRLRGLDVCGSFSWSLTLPVPVGGRATLVYTVSRRSGSGCLTAVPRPPGVCLKDKHVSGARRTSEAEAVT